MKFGAGDGINLQAHDFLLPAVKQTVLPGLPALHPKIYIGLPHWGKKEWVGKLYPAKTREKEFLNLYAAHFNSIELNATHYKIYPEENIISWRERVGDKDFKFCPKIYKGVTHLGRLDSKEKMVGEFLKSVNNFQKHIGPIFLQLPEAFSVNRKEELIRFLSTLPVTHKFFVELRHESWFNSGKDLNEIVAVLKSNKIGFIISDTIMRRDVLHMQLTTPETFIRFICTANEEIDKSRILQWKQQLQIWFKNGLQKCYFFIHLGDTPIEFAKFIRDEISNVIKLV